MLREHLLFSNDFLVNSATAGSEPREKRDFEKLRHSYLITFVLTCLLKTYDEKALYIYLVSTECRVTR